MTWRSVRLLTNSSTSRALAGIPLFARAFRKAVAEGALSSSYNAASSSIFKEFWFCASENRLCGLISFATIFAMGLKPGCGNFDTFWCHGILTVDQGHACRRSPSWTLDHLY
jgi:hypothetical protein